MAVRTERIDKWVRAYVDEVTVAESREPLLFWEEHFPSRDMPFAGARFEPICCGSRRTTRLASRSSFCPRGRYCGGTTSRSESAPSRTSLGSETHRSSARCLS